MFILCSTTMTMAEDINRYNFEKITYLYLVLDIYVSYVGITYCICRRILILKDEEFGSRETVLPKSSTIFVSFYNSFIKRLIVIALLLL